MRRTFLAALLVPLTLAGCARNPASGEQEFVLVSEQGERQAGQAAAKQIEEFMGLVENEPLQAYVRGLGERLAANSPRPGADYRFAVLDAKEPNAFALPGGPVYVTRGLLVLLNSEDELAGTMGHEVGHVAARHHVRQATARAPFAVLKIPGAIVGVVSGTLGKLVNLPANVAGGLVLSPYSRDQESEADRLGADIAAATGYDPAALVSSLETLERDAELRTGESRNPSFFDTHPATPGRISDLRQHLMKQGLTASQPRRASAYLKRIDGLVVGDGAKGGVFADSRFLHPELRLSFLFPKGWTTHNTDQVVIGVDPTAERERFCLFQISAKGTAPAQGALADGFKEKQVAGFESLQVNGLPALRSVDRGRKRLVHATWIAHRGHVYRMACASPASGPDWEARFDATAGSFRSLQASDWKDIRERRIRLFTARSGENVDALVDRTGSTWSAERVAMANALAGPDVRFAGGEKLKIAVWEPYRAKR